MFENYRWLWPMFFLWHEISSITRRIPPIWHILGGEVQLSIVPLTQLPMLTSQTSGPLSGEVKASEKASSYLPVPDIPGRQICAPIGRASMQACLLLAEPWDAAAARNVSTKPIYSLLFLPQLNVLNLPLPISSGFEHRATCLPWTGSKKCTSGSWCSWKVLEMQNYAQIFTHSTKYDHICLTMMLTPNTSHCIGSLDCDRLVEKNQIAESLTVGPAVQIISFTMFRCQINRSFRRAKMTHKNNFQKIISLMQST